MTTWRVCLFWMYHVLSWTKSYAKLHASIHWWPCQPLHFQFQEEVWDLKAHASSDIHARPTMLIKSNQIINVCDCSLITRVKFGGCLLVIPMSDFIAPQAQHGGHFFTLDNGKSGFNFQTVLCTCKTYHYSHALCASGIISLSLFFYLFSSLSSPRVTNISLLSRTLTEAKHVCLDATHDHSSQVWKRSSKRQHASHTQSRRWSVVSTCTKKFRMQLLEKSCRVWEK